jgi:ribosomal protein S18 acetylase RimI-like enzyme
MKTVIRNYQKSDYSQCETLVNEAWNFDTIFSPYALANLAKYIYTQGSVVGSNYQKIVEIDGSVAGLLFGYNENGPKTHSSIFYLLAVLWRLLWIKSEKPVGKKELFNAIKIHAQNRLKLVPQHQSEIVLFVISKKYQQQEYGKLLWHGFKEVCQKSNVSSIIVEANKSGASSFYEMLGFKHQGDFESPLHTFATKEGQACIYRYVLEKSENN